VTRIQTADEIRRLTSGGLFAGLPAAMQAEVLKRSVVRSFGKGQCLIREGQPGKGLHGLLHGRTHHLRLVGESDQVLLHVGEPGIWFGEFPLVTGQPAVGSVVAATAVRTLFLARAEFERLLEADPRCMWPVARLLGERYALAFRYAAEARGLAPLEWLRSRLYGILEVQQSGTTGSGSMDITVSQSELANMVGLSRQTLNALLAELEARGFIKVGYRRIRVLGRRGEPA
jgi:CRP-like cAMP-binding protein